MAQLSNSSYQDSLETIESKFDYIKADMEAASIEGMVKEILSSSALIAPITDLFSDEGISLNTAVSTLIKLLMENEKLKNRLIQSTPLNDTNYDFFAATITGSVDITLEYFSLDGLLSKGMKAGPVASGMASSFSRFVGFPLALYETGLKVITASVAVEGIYKILRDGGAAKIDALAASFIYDFVDNHSSDMDVLKSKIEKKSYEVKWRNVNVFDNEIGKRSNIKLDSFFHVFYWATLIFNKYEDINVSSSTDREVLIKAARKALDHIENYGSGGNFKFVASYKLYQAEGGVGKKLVAYNSPIFFNQLYFMPPLTSRGSNSESYLLDYFYGNNGPFLGPITPLSVRLRNVNYTVTLNATYPAKVVPIDEFKFGNKLESIDYVWTKINPVVNVSFEYAQGKITDIFFDNKYQSVNQNKVFGEFYLSYGLLTGISSNKTPFAIDEFVDFYNLGLIDTSQKKYNALGFASSNFVVDTLFKFIDKTSFISAAGSNIKPDYWKFCENNGICGIGKSIERQSDGVTRQTLFQVLVDKYQLTLDCDSLPQLEKYKCIKAIRTFDLAEQDWTEAGKTLYRLGVIKGDTQTGKMNASSYISNIELILIASRVKELIKGKRL